MAIFGSLIKSLIEIKENFTSEEDAVKQQEEVLRELLKKAQDTAFGKHYHFEEILEAENMQKAFAEKVPYFDYNKIASQWWDRYHEGEEDVTWPGKPPYFALSSGTTGKTSKRIPVTQDMLDAIRSAGIKQVSALSNFDLPADFLKRKS